MNIKKLYLLRHAAHIEDSVTNPSLSGYGREQSVHLGQKIVSDLAGDEVIVWSSPAARAIQTAEIIKKQLCSACEKMVAVEKLWHDAHHRADLGWLKIELENFKGKNLIIVSHMLYVQHFPRLLGFEQNHSNYAQGVLIENGNCLPFCSLRH
jgi:broad specificity phosphatase PhoE